MAHIQNLKIKNFRAFDSIEVDGLSRINLFVGKNSVGKSSILEALFLITGMANPMLAISVHEFRGLGITSANQLRYLFHNLDFENKPNFKAKFSDSSERTLEFKAKYQEGKILNKGVPLSVDYGSARVPKLVGLDLNFSLEKAGEQRLLGESSLVFDGNEVKPTMSDYNEDMYSAFVPSTIQDDALFPVYSFLFKQNQHGDILRSLQAFDGNVENILPLDDGIYFEMKGLGPRVPSYIMGDGIRRFLNIMITASMKHDQAVFIEEIENGLHYFAHELLWKNLIEFVEKYNLQLFVTTHNKETLAYFKAALEQPDSEAMREHISVFIVANTQKAGYKTYRYSYEGLKSAIEHDNELRR